MNLSLNRGYHMDIKKQFGCVVAVKRHKLGLSQEEFAERCGLHRTYVSDIERGARNVGLENVAKIAAALGINISELFQDINP
jgi:transcriptional regulator with XRE-family HTH domain